MSASWESAFVAVASIAGEPLDAVAAAIGEGPGGRRHDDLLAILRSAPRETRAQALARVLTDVALAIDAGDA